MERIHLTLVEWACLIFLNIIGKVLLRNAPSCFCPRKESDTSCSLRWYWGFNWDQDLLHARQALYKWDIFLDQQILLFCLKICLRSLILNSRCPHSLIWEDIHRLSWSLHFLSFKCIFCLFKFIYFSGVTLWLTLKVWMNENLRKAVLSINLDALE